ncbi:MAG: hypothetical protein Q7W30_08310 [Coriobacteriia bacterium]|nr:hypothetical protein [Coriobacteriia bacterium]
MSPETLTSAQEPPAPPGGTAVGTADAGDRPSKPVRWPLFAFAALWTALTPFVLGLAVAIIYGVELAMRRMTLRHDLGLSAAIEAACYLLVAFLAFRFARRLDPPRWFWVVGPLGYLAGLAANLALGALAGGALLGLNQALAVYAACDVTACAAGALAAFALRRRAHTDEPADAAGSPA